MTEPENGTVVAIRWRSPSGFECVSVYWRDDGRNHSEHGTWWLAGDERESTWEEAKAYAYDIQKMGVVKP